MNKLSILNSLFFCFFFFTSLQVFSQEPTCADAESNSITVDCTTGNSSFTAGPGDGTDDPELAGTCLDPADVEWYAFSIDPAIITFDFDDFGDDVVLFEGADCSSLTELQCQGGFNTYTNAGDLFFVAAVDGADFEFIFPAAPSNEDCSSAEPLNGTLSAQNNVCANAPSGGCSGDNSVWFEVDVANDGTTLTVEVTPDGANPIANPEVDIYDSCGGAAVSTNGACTDVVEAECLLAGTYFVEVSSAAADAGEFSIEETPVTGPAEDLCSGAVALNNNPVVCGDFLTGTGDNTTCPDSEATSGDCMDGVIGTWYTFTADASLPEFTITSNDNFELFEGSCGSLNSLGDCSIEGTAISADPSTTYFVLIDGNGEFDLDTPMAPMNISCSDAEDIDIVGTGPVNNCCLASGEIWYKIDPVQDGVEIAFTNLDVGGSLAIELYEGCGGPLVYDDTGDFTEEFPNCGESYFVRVTSAAADCGSFEINYAYTQCGVPIEDACSASVPVTTLNLNNPVCIPACAQNSCSGTCQSNGLWFAVDFAEAGSVLTVSVDNIAGNFDPVISIYENDCSTAEVSCEGSDEVQIGVAGGNTYFIEIASAGVAGDFDVCFLYEDVPSSCAEWDSPTITRPEFPGADQEGPFCPGETVEFCFDLTFTTAGAAPPNGNNCQWLQGVIPVMGDGWDLDATPLDGQVVNSDLPDWHDDVLYFPHNPTTNPVLGLEPSPHNSNGIALTYPTGGLSSGDLLPGGWYGVTTTGGGNCDGGSDPNGAWGVNPGGCNASATFPICFELTVKQFEDEQECEEADLSIKLFAMADGMTGCWDNTACAQDMPADWTDGEVECDGLVELEADDVIVCSGDPADVFIDTANGDDADIYVFVVEENQTSGAMDHEPLAFGTNSAVLIDEIENTSGSIQVVTYMAFARGELCDGPPIEFTVTVLPAIEIFYDEPIIICPGDTYPITPTVTGGTPPFSYLWISPSGDELSEDPNFVLPHENNLDPGEHFVTFLVTDSEDCTQDISVDYELTPGINHSIDGPLDICISGNMMGTEYCADHDTISTSSNYDYQWTFGAGVVLSTDDDEKCVTIDESVTPPGTYNMTLEIFDDFDCVHDTTVIFTLSNGPSLVLEPGGCNGSDLKLLGINTNHANVPSFLHIVQPSGPGGTLLPGDTLGTGIPLLTDTLCVTTSNLSLPVQLIGASSGGCMPAPVSYTIPPVETPMFTAPTAPICEGESVTLSLSNPGTFTNAQWTDGTNVWMIASITESPTTNTTYTFTATNPLGCEVNEQFNIIVNELPGAEISGSATFCAGQSSDLTATTTGGTGPFTYIWSDNSTAQTLNVTTAGTYSVTITDATQCSSEDSVEVTVDTELDVNISYLPFCAGDQTQLTVGAFDSYEWFDASGTSVGTGPTLDNIASGSYYVEVSLGNCPGTSPTIEVMAVEDLPDLQGLTIDPVCNASGGAFDVTLNLDMLIPPQVQGFWRDENDLPISNSSDVSFLGDPAGTVTYSYITTNATAPCVNDTISLDILVNECDCPPPVSQLPDQCGAGSMEINLNSLTSSTGSWSSTSTDLVINNGLLILDETTPTGTYTVEFTHDVTLPDNCTAPYETTFTVYQPLTAELDQTAIPCNSSSTMEPTFVDLSSLILSGDNSGTWETTNSAVTITNDIVDFVNLPTGPYDFTYRLEELGSPCGPQLLTATVNVRDCSCPPLVMNALDPMCSSGGVINLNDSSILNNPDALVGVWSMTPDVPGALLGDQFTVDGVPADTYTFTFTLQNPTPNCDEFVSQEMVVSEPLEAMVPMSIEACNGVIDMDPRPTELDLESLVTGDMGGTWTVSSNFNGGIIDDINQVDFIEVDPDTYTFTYTVPANGACDETSYPLEVEVVSCNCPNFDADYPDLCSADGEYDLNDIWVDPTSVDPGSWVQLSGDSQVAISMGSLIDLSSMDGRYQFGYIVDNLPAGCDPLPFFFSVETPPDVMVTDNLTVCNAESTMGDNCISLNANASGAAGVWTIDPTYTNNATDITNICFDGIDPGTEFTFEFNVPNNNSACGPQDFQMRVLVLDCSCPNIAILQPDDICEGSLITLSDLEANPALIADGGWTVDNPDGIIAGDNFVPSEPGVYVLRYTADDPGAPPCEPFSEVTVSVVERLSAGSALPPYEICGGNDETVDLSTRLMDSNPGGGWSAASTNPTGGTFDDIAGTFNSAGAADGTYEFMYTIAATPECTGDDVTIQIEISGGPVADAGTDAEVACEDTAELGGPNTTTGAGVTYSWTSTTGEDLPTEATIDVNLAGTYTLMVTDAAGCTATDEVVITGVGGLSVESEVMNPPCFGEPGILIVTATGGNGNVQYSVDGGATFQGDDIFNSLEPGSYTLVVEDESGCRSIQEFVVNEPAVLEVDAGEDRQVEIGDEQYTLEAAVSIDSDSIVNVLWTDCETGEPLCEGNYDLCGTIMVNPEIFNEYCVVVTDVNGCTSESSVILREKLVRDVYIPNVFDPNENDPTNQTFHVHADRFVESVNFLDIYDRWGELVYSAPANHPPNDPAFGWNGKWNNDGNNVEQGVYVYFIEVQYVDNGNGAETEIYAGDITIIR